MQKQNSQRYRPILFALLLIGAGALAFGLNLIIKRTDAAAQAQVGASSPDGLWREIPTDTTNARAGRPGKSFKLDRNALDRTLSRAPREFTLALKDSPAVVSLPLPTGKFARFRVVESNVLDPELARRFPEIKSYAGQGIDDPTATMRFGWSPRGLTALSIGKDYTFTVAPPDPRDATTYFSAYDDGKEEIACGVQAIAAARAPKAPTIAVGSQLRVYRMAIATSAAYLADPMLGGGSIPNAVASLNAWINSMNVIFERELAVRMTLVNNTQIIGLPANQITNTSESTALNQIPPILGAMVGSANYDIGHVLITAGGGGIAGLGVICDSGNMAAPRKGAGSSSVSGPAGVNSVGLLAHEIGHQFGAPHTFNGTIGQNCNNSRSGDSAVETGSGATLMSYNGLCGGQGGATDNISGETGGRRFHNRSFNDMSNTIALNGSCATLINTNNNPPNVTGGGDFTIPRLTPFELTAAASDPDAGDQAALTYNWEQLDAGGGPCPGPNCFAQTGTAASYKDENDPATTTRPIFRPFASSSSPTRTFPSLIYILNNANTPPDMMPAPFGDPVFTAENLPAIGRTLNFRITVRDNRTMGGGVADDNVRLTVAANSGPFRLTAPNTAADSWTKGGQQTVTWDVAGTNNAPVNAANVRILLSTDGGQTFPFVLAANTPNDGTEGITVPTGLNTSTARVKIQGVGNVFFDLSDFNFTINGGAGCPAISSVLPSAGAVGTVVTITAAGLTGVTGATFSPNVAGTNLTVVNATTLTVTVPTGAMSGPITLTKAGCPNTVTASFTVCADSAVLQTDDNTLEGVGGGVYFVNRVTPAAFPATLSQVDIRFNSFVAPALGADFTIIVAAHPGGANIDNTTFQSFPAKVVALDQFVSYGVAPLTINNGDFLVGYQFPQTPGVFPVARDNTTPQMRSYGSFDGANFTVDATANYGIRARTVGNCALANCVTATNIAPITGAPGTSVNITGTGFIGVTSVRFSGGAAAQFTINSDTSITATVPPGATTGAITISRPGCADAMTASFTVTAVACPTVAGFTPMTAMPGGMITITGTGFSGVNVVKFGGGAGAMFTVVNDTTITATVPADVASGALTLSKPGCPNTQSAGVFEPCGISQTLQIEDGTVQAAGGSGNENVVNRLTPAGYPATLTAVSLRFDAFAGVAANTPITVLAGRNPGGTATLNNLTLETVNTTVQTLGQFFTVTLPAPVTINAGDFVVGYRIAGGTTLINTVMPRGRSYNSFDGRNFTQVMDENYLIRAVYTQSCAAPPNPCPTVTNIAPTMGAPGATVTITGTNFTGVTGVNFSTGAAAVNFTVVNATTITAVVPAAAVTGPITVIKPNCADTTSAAFTVNQPPACQTVTTIAPNSGRANTTVTITGTNFTGVNEVIFTNGQAAQFNLVSPTTITAVVPAAAMTGAITIKKPTCPDAPTKSFTILPPPCPTVQGFAPMMGPVGQEVTITGTNFTPLTTVEFENNLMATVIFDSGTQVRAVVPAGTVNGKIKVGQANCPDAQTAQDFFVTLPCPTVNTVTPAGAQVGVTVTISGTNLTGVTGVRFSPNIAAMFTVVDAATITAVVPANAATGAIKLEKTNCTDVMSPNFTVLAAAGVCPTVTGINPTRGAIGSTVTITGAGLTGVNEAFFYDLNGLPLPVVTPTVVSDNLATVVVPTGAGFFGITLRKPNCTDADTPAFAPCGTDTVLGGSDGTPETTQGGGVSHFINRITPNGYPATLTGVRLRFDANQNIPKGTNFTVLAAGHPSGLAAIDNTTFQMTTNQQVGTLGTFVTYNVNPPITINSGDFLVGFTGITVGTPALLDTTMPFGRSYESQDGAAFFALTGDPNLLIDARINVSCTAATCPTVANFNPTTGGFGTGILITGTGFTNVTAVKFGNLNATNFTVMSDTEISAFAPTGVVTGPITLSKANCTDVQAGIFNVCAPITITPGVLQAGAVGALYNATFVATPPLTMMPTWTVGLGMPLPPGLTLNAATGELMGTPTMAGTFMFTINYGEPFNLCGGLQAYTLTINAGGGCPTITATPTGLVPGTAGVAYTNSVSGIGGAFPYTAMLMSGTLPLGLTLAADGAITGTPTTPGKSSNIVVKLTDANGCMGTATYSLSINPATCQDIKVGEFFQTPSGAVGAAYTTTIPVTPAGAYTFALTGTLPAGLTLNPATGEISGTPTAAGGAAVFITATAGNNCVGGNNFTIEICPTITVAPAMLNAGAVGVAYTQQLTSTPAADPLFGGFEVVVPGTGPLPPGLTLSQMGLLSGTPTTAGTFPFTVDVLIGGQCRGQKQYSLTVNAGGCAAITVNPATLAAGTENTAYTNGGVPISASPAGTYTFAVTAGALPTGITINATTGAFSGMTAATGTFTFTVTATDANNCTGTRQYSLTINDAGCPVITIEPLDTTLPAATTGTQYAPQTFTQTGAPGAVTWSTTGNVPTGLAINATAGVLSGTPTVTGTFTFTVRATSGTCMGERQYLLAVNAACPTITVNPTNVTLTAGTVGTAYVNANLPFTQTGGTGTTAWDVPNGALPDGLTLNPTTGALTGMPQAPGNFTFTVRVTVGGCTGQRQYTLTINPAGNGLQFYPLPSPLRLLDTRPDQSLCDNVGAPIMGMTSITTQARITCNNITIPASAQAIVGNVTVINQTASFGFLTLFPAGQTLPLAANIIYEPGQLLSNNFTVGLNANGEFSTFAERTLHTVIDVSGYFAPPGAGGLFYHALPRPLRLMDTRADQSLCDNVGLPITGMTALTTQARITCNGITIPTAAQAIVGNATVINQTASFGFMTLFPSGQTLPLAANMIYAPNQLLANAFTVGLSANGQFDTFAERTLHLVIDIAGYYSTEANDLNGPGLLFNPLPRPLRLLDTRPDQSLCDNVGVPIAAMTAITTQARITCQGITIPAAAQAVNGNITVINQTASFGFLTLFPAGQTLPLAANMIYAPGQLLSNAFTVGLSAGGAFDTFGERTIHVVIDVSGYFAP